MHFLDEGPIGVGDEQPEAGSLRMSARTAAAGSSAARSFGCRWRASSSRTASTSGTPAAAQATASACISLPDGSMP